ncbi:hypothetical protein BT96DRAFT_678603 [Gymnopus androsaceus JB14]|uniref:Uncharacterized protein n=1 Tax=Gymnopus androsaceus JB14 TaxID=1447944 RepID=A0A6A4HP32_9AGAR|nr:hypothetical protein BT96DRAFT_678603 [Gymnopus androsaceus JB14]
MPKLDSFVSDICDSRAGTDILIPWIRSFFEPLLKLDGHTHPLRHFNLVVSIHSYETDQYAVLDRLFAEPVFAPLEMVSIVAKGSNLQKLFIPIELLGHKLPFRKLKVDFQTGDNTSAFLYQAN